MGHVQIVHSLLELLAGCIEEDPPGVIAFVATATTSTAGRRYGYQYELAPKRSLPNQRLRRRLRA